MRRIIGTERQEVVGEQRKLHNEELRNLYPSQNVNFPHLSSMALGPSHFPHLSSTALGPTHFPLLSSTALGPTHFPLLSSTALGPTQPPIQRVKLKVNFNL
jgi:hypothetical protein